MIDGCFLKCHGRVLKTLVGEEKVIHIDALPLYKKYNASYESMMTAIHIVWAVMLWRAADEPARHPLFIDFTIWANAAHGLVMLLATPMQKDFFMTLIEGLPLFVIAAVLAWLRPKRSAVRPAIYPKTA